MPKKLETIVECDMFKAIDLSKNIPWTITKVDDEEESNGMEQEAEPKVEISKVLLFCKRMKRLSPHRLPLKKRMKDQTISYVDLLCPDFLPTRLEEDHVPQVCRRLESRRVKSKDDMPTSDK